MAPAPRFTGLKTFQEYPLEELVERIDWTPFFLTWELRGTYPGILTDPKYGKEATSLLHDAETMLRRIVDRKLLTASAVIGFFPANSVGDDVELYADEVRDRVLKTFHFLRQQNDKSRLRPNLPRGKLLPGRFRRTSRRWSGRLPGRVRSDGGDRRR